MRSNLLIAAAKWPLAATVLMAIVGCTTTKDWAATGGSRADGVVRLSYEVGEFERAELSAHQAITIASSRCRTWGYAHAEAFGGVTRQCNQWGGFGGCARWLVTKEFQCTGTGNAQNHPAPTHATPAVARAGAAQQAASVPNPDTPVARAQMISNGMGCGTVAPAPDANGRSVYMADCQSGRIRIDCAGAGCVPTPVQRAQQECESCGRIGKDF